MRDGSKGPLVVEVVKRRVVARMQHRIGPNVNGPFGLLQPLADGVKLTVVPSSMAMTA